MRILVTFTLFGSPFSVLTRPYSLLNYRQSYSKEKEWNDKVGKSKREVARTPSKTLPPALSIEARESYLASLAMDLAEEQIREGTASSQVITHYLKIGSTEQRLKMERLEEENKLLRAKTDALQSAKKVEELYADAIAAMKVYSGHGTDE